MDLLLDKDAFAKASSDLADKCMALNELRTKIVATFEQLRNEWDSDAGKEYFSRIDRDLLKNLEDYSKVFEYMSKNLSTAMTKYEEVFTAANAVADAQF